MKRITTTLTAVLCGLGLALATFAAEAPANPEIPAELAASAEQSLAKGATWLLSHQNEDGSWGKYPHPAIAALGAMALHNCPGVDATARDAAIDRAMAYMLTFRQENGAIYPAARDQSQTANYPNYTTSIALLALATVNRPEYLPIMKAARKYLQGSQFNDPNTVDYGGIGYGRTERADVSNGSWATEALHFTDYLDHEPHTDDPEAAKRTQEMWARMQLFLTKCQNLPETNPQPYVSKDERDLGGFVYRPYESKAGSRDEAEDSQTNLVSSGSMTYAGLKSMIHAKLERSDVRVKGAMSYLMRNWTLTENPGMGAQGLYYYLHVMTKALDAYGQPVVVDSADRQHVWREEVLKQFIALQAEDGSWANSNGRYMENLPELSTSYSMIAMQVALGRAALQDAPAPPMPQ